jgi:uncharacterized protein
VDQSGVILYCILALFAGGLFKGVAGLGLPLVGVPLLTVVLSLKSAIGVLVVPLIFSNLFQSFEGGLFLPVARRFWPLYATLFLTIAVSTQALIAISERYLFALIGIALIMLPTIARLQPRLRVRPRQEPWLAPLAGALAGVFGGVSSYYGPALMLYVMWLRLPKAEFVVAVSQMFSVGAVGLAIGLYVFGVATPTQFGVSALACIPVLAGLVLGQRVRFRMSEQRFALVIFVTYVVTGFSFLVRLL